MIVKQSKRNVASCPKMRELLLEIEKSSHCPVIRIIFRKKHLSKIILIIQMVIILIKHRELKNYFIQREIHIQTFYFKVFFKGLLSLFPFLNELSSFSKFLILHPFSRFFKITSKTKFRVFSKEKKKKKKKKN